MSTQTRTAPRPAAHTLPSRTWVTIGAVAAIASVAGVLLAQAAALSVWPEAASFRPLESYPRSVLFTVVPAALATAVFAWLARRRADPVRAFVSVAAVVLVLSFIPDYILPDANKTFLASTIAAMLHVVAGVLTTGVLVAGYMHQTGQCEQRRAAIGR